MPTPELDDGAAAAVCPCVAVTTVAGSELASEAIDAPSVCAGAPGWVVAVLAADTARAGIVALAACEPAEEPPEPVPGPFWLPA
jgi:hypothetical protein